jgi:uncharacterized membrane protein YjfL (UPF0719 family)
MGSLQITAAPLLLALAHVGLGVVVLILAKLMKDRLSPYRLDHEMTAQDNPAFGLAVSGYYVGTVCIYLGVARPQDLPLDLGSRAVLEALGAELIWTSAGIVALAASRWLMNIGLVAGVRSSEQIMKNRNVAAGAVEAGVYVASGLVLSGSLRETGGTPGTAAVFFLLSQVVLLVFGRLYQRLAGYDVPKEILKANLAAGVAFGFTLVALALLMFKATSGEFIDWPTNLGYFAFDAIVGFVLLRILRWVTDAALLPNARVAEEIVRDRNVNAGLLEGVLAASIAAIILFVF